MHPDAHHVYNILLLALRSRCKDQVLPWLCNNLHRYLPLSRQLILDIQRHFQYNQTHDSKSFYKEVKHQGKNSLISETLEKSCGEEDTHEEIEKTISQVNQKGRRVLVLRRRIL